MKEEARQSHHRDTEVTEKREEKEEKNLTTKTPIHKEIKGSALHLSGISLSV